MDVVRESERERQQELYSELNEVQDALNTQEDAQATVQVALERMVARRGAKHDELSELASKKSTIEVELQETQAAAKTNSAESKRLAEQLKDIVQQVRQCEQRLREVEPVFADRTAQLGQMQSELAAVRSQVETLYGKQGRGAQFHTKQERDRFLQTQIDSLSQQIEQTSVLLQRSVREVEQEEGRLQGERQQIQQAEAQQKARAQRYEDIGALVRERTQQRNALQEQRKSGWKELELVQEQLQEAHQELEKGRQQLNRAIPRHIAQGLAAVETIVQQQSIQGYHGPLIDNVSLVADAFRHAVEVAAGNSLFHVIVDTDDTAAHLIKELDRLKAGRLTFLPLNRLQNPNIKYPDSNDVRPLMSVALRFEPEVELAVKQVGNQFNVYLFSIQGVFVCFVCLLV
jgi:structural maintenance of chromosome 3 (chondroitin sulfate proteoglycan 6)